MGVWVVGWKAPAATFAYRQQPKKLPTTTATTTTTVAFKKYYWGVFVGVLASVSVGNVENLANREALATAKKTRTFSQLRRCGGWLAGSQMMKRLVFYAWNLSMAKVELLRI